MKRFFLGIIFGFMVLSAFSQSVHVSKKYYLQKLGDHINTGHHEAAPVISADGKTLYFFVSNHKDNTFGAEGSQDIWMTRLNESGEWSNPEHIDKPLNNNHSNQVFTILNGGNTLFIRGTSKRDEKGFSFTNKQGDGWSKPEDLKVEGFEEMARGRFYGATISSDANHMILYFSENPRTNWSDLYYSKNVGSGKFSKPVKLKGNVNTGLDEFGAYLAPDDKTLYYASDRRDMGLGGADLYVIRRLDDTWLNWTTPENLGAPINTPVFDGYISVDAEENIYIAMAGKSIDGGNLDIYHVVPKEIKMMLNGNVIDAATGTFVSGNLKLINGDIEDTILVAKNQKLGYQVYLKNEGKYRIEVSKKGYLDGFREFVLDNIFADTTVSISVEITPEEKPMMLFAEVINAKTGDLIQNATIKYGLEANNLDREVVATTGKINVEVSEIGEYSLSAAAKGYLENTGLVFVNQNSPNGNVQILLDPLEIGTTVVLKNIYFDFDKTSLKSESFPELEKVVKFMNDNPTIKVEISGHTDSKGSDQYNLDLSQGRAQAVVNYINSQGIDFERMMAQGYGETKPISTNDTEEGRSENRRVEFTVLEL